jgi:hypothetical protein
LRRLVDIIDLEEVIHANGVALHGTPTNGLSTRKSLLFNIVWLG